MIIVKLQGGLGNQLFQYAIGRRLSLYHQTPLKLDISFAADSAVDPLITPRQYELHKFSIKAEIATEKEIRLFSVAPKYFRQLWKKLSRYKTYRENGFLFNQKFLQFARNSYLDGYWQCEKYFIDIENELIRDLTLSASLSKENLEMLGRIKAVNSVSIHVRRGDYISNPSAQSFHGVCSLGYYSKAMELLATKTSDPHFFVFSDDIAWVHEHFKFSYPFTIVGSTNENNCENDLHLMSKCNHHIIANSSFSWWAAWLNRHPGKIVAAPAKWFNDPSINTSTIVPESWYKI